MCRLRWDSTDVATLVALQAELPPLDFAPLAGRGRRVYIGGIHAAVGGDYLPLAAMFGRVIARAESLQRRLRREIKEQQRQELEHVMGVTPRRAKVPRTAKPEGARGGPVLAAYADRPKLLRGRYKGKLYRARVLRDGSIRFGGETYNSPSLAARAARERPTANGWSFWTYQRAPGEWVRLRELRR